MRRAQKTYEAYGGAVYSDDTLTTTHDTYSSNSASNVGASFPEAYGGAIYSEEPMTMTADSLVGNSATSSYEAYGGALYADDTTTAINNSAFTSNTANGGYEGWGGVYNYDGMSMGGSVISGNTATIAAAAFIRTIRNTLRTRQSAVTA